MKNTQEIKLSTSSVTPKTFIVFDLETNGKSHIEDRILEIYAIGITLLPKTVRIKEFHRLIKIEQNNVDLFIQLVRGWDNNFLNEYGVHPEQAITEFYKFIRDYQQKDPNTLISGYNITGFDNKFIKKAFKRYGLGLDIDYMAFDCFIEYKSVLLKSNNGEYLKDWRRRHKRVLNNEYAYNKIMTTSGVRVGLSLREACHAYRIDFNDNMAHFAKYDTIKSLQLLIHLMPAWFDKAKSKLIAEKIKHILS